MKAIMLSVAFLLTLIALNRCSRNSSEEGESRALTATLSSAAYSVSRVSPFDKIWRSVVESVAFATGTAVDQVWALPMYGGEFHPQAMQYLLQEDISSDGSFSLSLREMDWGIVLINSSASTDLEKIVGYVTMTAGDVGLQKIALGSATDSIDLGTLTSNGTETTSTVTSETNASKLGFTQAQILAMAKTDDTLKVIKNVFGNYDRTTGFYTTIKPFYLWSYGSAQSALKDQYTTPATTVTKFAGYLYYFNSNNTAINYAAVCANTQALALYPPSTVTNMSENVTFNASTPLTSTGSSNGSQSNSCGIGHIYLRDDTGLYGSGASYQFNFGINGEYLKPAIPSGNWTLKAGSTTIATFDGQLGTPFTDADSTKPFVFIPSVKATSSGGNIASIDVKWYQRNTTSGDYEQVTDTDLLKQMSSVSIDLTQYTGSTVEERKTLEDGVTEYTFTPTENTWNFVGIGSGGKLANSIAISYQLNGVSYRFEHRQY